MTAAAIERGATLTGIDISAEMVAMAQSKGLKADFRTGDAEALAFPDAAFNRVICNFGHFHLQEPNRAIAEAARVLERAGRYAYTTWCGPDVSPSSRISEAVQAHGRMDVGLPPAPSPFRLSDRSESMKAMQDAGFTNIGSAISRPISIDPRLTYPLHRTGHRPRKHDHSCPTAGWRKKDRASD